MTVESPFRKTEGAYHHGDLRSALLGVARRELDAGSYETLSLRELARLAGVSPNAPYRHFKSKDEILAEIAAQGFDELTARFDADMHPEPRERLVRMCDVYTGFALEHPNVYRVMFGAEKAALMDHDVLRLAAEEAFGRLVAAVIAAYGSGAPDDLDTLARANQIWSAIHGWSRLVIDGVTCFLPEGSVRPASNIARAIVASW
jgi:AcrR family transcriptional regulator